MKPERMARKDVIEVGTRIIKENHSSRAEPYTHLKCIFHFSAHSFLWI